jgi:hypothetical protein
MTLSCWARQIEGEFHVRALEAARAGAVLLICLLLGTLVGVAVMEVRGHSGSTSRPGVAQGTGSPLPAPSSLTSLWESPSFPSPGPAASTSSGASATPCATPLASETPGATIPGSSLTPDPSLVAAMNAYYSFIDTTHQTYISTNLDPTAKSYGWVSYWVVGVGFFEAHATVRHVTSGTDRVSFSGDGTLYPGFEGDLLLAEWETLNLAEKTPQTASFQIDATIDRVGLTATATLTYEGQSYALSAPLPPNPRPAIDTVVQLIDEGDWAGFYDDLTPTAQKIISRDAFVCGITSVLMTKYGATSMSVRVLSDPQVEGGHVGPWTAMVKVEVTIEGTARTIQSPSWMEFVYTDRWLMWSTGDLTSLAQ